MTKYDTHLSILKIEGNQAETFIQGQVTQDVKAVTHNHPAYTAICNQKGRVIADGYLLKEDAHWLIILHQTLIEKVHKRLSKYAQLSGCTVSEDARHCVGYANDRYIKIAPNLSINLEQDPCPQKDNAWCEFEILNLIPRIEIRTSECFTPHMLEMDKKGALSFSKGCYVGQEIVARTHYLGKNKRALTLINKAIDASPGGRYDYQGKSCILVSKTDHMALAVCPKTSSGQQN